MMTKINNYRNILIKSSIYVINRELRRILGKEQEFYMESWLRSSKLNWGLKDGKESAQQIIGNRELSLVGKS